MDINNSGNLLSVPSNHQVPLIRKKSGSLDNGMAQPNIVLTGNGQVPGLARATSLSLRDVDRQRKSDQDLEGQNFAEDDPMFDSYFRNASAKNRRVSKSLPELRGLKQFPLVATHYNTVDESDEEDDDSLTMNDIPVTTAWSAKSEFIFTGIGLALGLNNIWRFPYFCYNNSGGSFLVAYMIVMFTCGLPLLAMEYAMGQLTRRGPIAAFGSLCPLLKGVSVAAALAALLLAPLYSAVNSWSLSYFLKSFYSVPLWSRCTNQWNTVDCVQNTSLVTGLLTNLMNRTVPGPGDMRSPYIDTEYEATEISIENANSSGSSLVDIEELIGNETTTASIMPINESSLVHATQQFFDRKLLELNINGSEWGEVQWELLIFVFVTWFAVFVSLRKNILFSAHPTYCLAILPHIILGVLFARSLALEGSKQGILYFLRPTWDGIRDPEVWLYAASLCFHSLGNVLGISFAKATCNKERNNFLRDAFLICLINAATIMFVGCTVFATLGSLALRRNVEISSVLVNDPGLAFIVFSELLSTMPFTALWSVVFFLILFCVGCDYQISVVASFLVAIEDAYGLSIKKTFLSHQFFIFLVCILSFGMSIIYTTQKGIFMIQLVDQYVTVLLTLILAFFEVILIGWFYGGQNLAQVIKLKVSKTLGCFFPFSWNIVIPFAMLSILGWNGYHYTEPLFRDTAHFPIAMQLVVHITVILLLLLIPIIAFQQVKKTPNTNLIIRILNACKPKDEQVTSQIFEMNGPDSRKPSSLFGGMQINPNPENSRTPSYRGSHTILRVPVTLSLIQGLDRETDI